MCVHTVVLKLVQILQLTTSHTTIKLSTSMSRYYKIFIYAVVFKKYLICLCKMFWEFRLYLVKKTSNLSTFLSAVTCWHKPYHNLCVNNEGKQNPSKRTAWSFTTVLPSDLHFAPTLSCRYRSPFLLLRFARTLLTTGKVNLILYWIINSLFVTYLPTDVMSFGTSVLAIHKTQNVV